MDEEQTAELICAEKTNKTKMKYISKCEKDDRLVVWTMWMDKYRVYNIYDGQ